MRGQNRQAAKRAAALVFLLCLAVLFSIVFMAAHHTHVHSVFCNECVICAHVRGIKYLLELRMEPGGFLVALACLPAGILFFPFFEYQTPIKLKIRMNN